ncbi:MAG TPA: sulfotransferase [Noviherbaspirillum sp.]|uniref:sulfotransferase family protein n=1 Tax=Noviherbaspirillum sp. TaxID=1926288 RepID=UPI002D50C896|nr:sulfotransferase [Noviherbaspirillum sp.]HYD96493.1 sulfotransferase [Noviherbaspirillum sp.]
MDNRPSSFYHPLPTKLFNFGARALNAAGIGRIALSEDALVAAARRETGLEHFGDDSHLPGLRVLLRSLEAEARLNPFGRFYAKTNIVGSLKNRLWANACFEAHPEIRRRKIVAPIVIVGPHRSGTTRMQRMMSADTRLSHLKTWEGFNPAPRPGLPDMGRTIRREEVRKALGAVDRLYPGAFVGHPMDADWAEEEMLLLNHSFCSFSILGSYHVPGYFNWFLQHDKTGPYRYMADLMRLISWSRGEPEGTRWVLKNPQHMLDLDALMAVFPDAKVVFTHRDPLKTVASVMSLMWHYAVQHTDAPMRGPMRDTWMRFCETAARRCIEKRHLIPASQQLDVYYDDMNSDWRAVMRRVYDFAGIGFSAEAEQALGGWLARSESESRHGSHRYSLDDFGITREEVDARMMFVRREYAIPYEGRRAA